LGSGKRPIFPRKLTAMERQYDKSFHVVFEAIRKLMAPPPVKRRRIGFHASEDDTK
jgi:hypothetical protein